MGRPTADGTRRDARSASRKRQEVVMKRRLYFLFPYPEQARRAVRELEQAGIGVSHVHALVRDPSRLEGLPRATPAQRTDAVGRIERVSWNLNLGIFLLALSGLVYGLATGSWAWSIACVVVTALSFVLGDWFTTHVPNVHLSEFTEALAHDEVLLMVDVPMWRVREIEDRIHSRHPEAAIGGVGWIIEGLGI
jgi:hypothetical protein